MFRVLIILAALALYIYALSDIAQSSENDRGGRPRWVWVLLVLILGPFGPFVWIFYARSRRNPAQVGYAAGMDAASKKEGSKPSDAASNRFVRYSSRPTGPDDDPDFLRSLGDDLHKKQQREEERKKKKAEESDSEEPDSPVN